MAGWLGALVLIRLTLDRPFSFISKVQNQISRFSGTLRNRLKNQKFKLDFFSRLMEDIILFVCCCHQRGGSDVIHFIGHRSDAITWSLEWIFPVSLSRTMRQFTVTSKIGMGGGYFRHPPNPPGINVSMPHVCGHLIGLALKVNYLKPRFVFRHLPSIGDPETNKQYLQPGIPTCPWFCSFDEAVAPKH